MCILQKQRELHMLFRTDFHSKVWAIWRWRLYASMLFANTLCKHTVIDPPQRWGSGEKHLRSVIPTYIMRVFFNFILIILTGWLLFFVSKFTAALLGWAIAMGNQNGKHITNMKKANNKRINIEVQARKGESNLKQKTNKILDKNHWFLTWAETRDNNKIIIINFHPNDRKDLN